MNVDVVCAWYRVCQRCKSVSGFSFARPVNGDKILPLFCTCGNSETLEWEPKVRLFFGDHWEQRQASLRTARLR